MTGQPDCPDFFTDGYCDTCIFSDECRNDWIILQEEKEKASRPKPGKGQVRL